MEGDGNTEIIGEENGMRKVVRMKMITEDEKKQEKR